MSRNETRRVQGEPISAHVRHVLEEGSGPAADDALAHTEDPSPCVRTGPPTTDPDLDDPDQSQPDPEVIQNAL